MGCYGLARHVFVCRDEEYIVVLDVKRDRYFALEATKTAALTFLLPGWPAPPPEQPPAEPSAQQAAAPLLREGWLVEKSAGSKEATPVQAPLPQADLMEVAGSGAARLRLRTIIAFVAASVFAKFALRFWRFERVVDWVARRKARHSDDGAEFDPERARQLIDAFVRLRVFLFSSREECLHDSLAVLAFLAQHGVFPSWVFGVRARPFEAHCWVQYRGIVCNDTVEQVSSYIPIMVV